MLTFSSFRSAFWSAFCAGAFVGVRVRASRRSPSGAVAVFVFAGSGPARAFAARWARRLGCPAVVRCVGGRFAVSLPLVFVTGGSPATPRWFPAGGGVRAVAEVVGHAVSFAAL